MGDGEAIRRRYRAGKQDLAGRVCVSFLISDDDGRQISEAAVKNCRRDWKTHFGREREEAGWSNGTMAFLTAASSSEARSSTARFSAPRPFIKCRGAMLISDKGGIIGN